jgi:lysophospholipase L1-like esterase
VAVVTLTGRQIGGGILVLAGSLMVASGALINPWVSRMLDGPASIDFADVRRSYFLWSWVLGAAVIWAGRRVGRARAASRIDGIAVLLLLTAVAILFDRFLLTRLGLTLWEHDPELHYRHRPGIERSLALVGRPDDVVRINAWGHHDTEIEKDKPEGQLRGIALGDSVTMGYGLTYAETFAAQLEARLSEDTRHTSHELVNTGVHGYATHQQRVVLERSLALDPDYVVLGFCLNDVTEPFVVDSALGGTGLDYHGVRQTPSRLMGWLANETGVGRLSQKLAERGRTKDEEKRLELYNVRAMAEGSRTEPRYQEAWRITLAQLDELYAVAAAHDLPVLVLVFPFTFQLADESLRAPQEILAEHAKAHGVDLVDLAPIFADAAFDDPELVAFLRARGDAPERITRLFSVRVSELFFDDDHFTAAGNAIVARAIHAWLAGRGMVDPA